MTKTEILSLPTATLMAILRSTRTTERFDIELAWVKAELNRRGFDVYSVPAHKLVTIAAI